MGMFEMIWHPLDGLFRLGEGRFRVCWWVGSDSTPGTCLAIPANTDSRKDTPPSVC